MAILIRCHPKDGNDVAERPLSRPAIRKSTAGSQSRSSTSRSLRWSYPTFATNAARFLTLASITYAAWRYGATDTLALYHLALSLGAALILVLSCRQTFQSGSKQLPVLFFGLILIWIGYATLQRTTIAPWLPAPFHGVLHVQEQWGTNSITLLSEAIERLKETRPVPLTGQFASVIPEETRQSSVPFLLASAAAILSALLFNTPKSRLIFLWAVIANASALAFWGIIQKASGGQQSLPGVENTFSTSMPFASFIYKNAGAAALLPALAGIAAILYRQKGNRDRSGSSSYSRDHFGSNVFLLETKNLILISLAVLLTVGLAASLSRGAWLAAILAAMVVGLLSRFTIHRREHLIFGSVASLAMVAVITLLGIGQEIRTRAEQVSLNYVSGDQRWSQWVDGFSTSMAHFPSGSGLGTYGYATLPHQSTTRRSWFREAHNQYLEVLTESGLIGVTVLFTAIGWFTLASWRLTRKRNDREKRSWGLLGISLLICGGFQSVFDFVLVIPANLILYASLIGVVGAVEQTPANRSKSRDRFGSNVQHRSAVSQVGPWRYVQLPAAWCGVALLCVISSFRAAGQQLFSEQSLATANVAQFENQPSAETVSASIRALSAAIDGQPRNAALYQCRANWHLAAYRLEVLKTASRAGIAVDWHGTRLEDVFGILSSQNAENRTALLTELRSTQQMRSALADGLSDLSLALSLDPLSPRGHLTGCVLAPITGMPVKPWLESTAALVNNSSEMLYMNGLFAFQSDELDFAVDQWSKSVAINYKYLTPILDLSQEKLPPIRVVTDLVPSSRPDLLVHLVRSTKRDPSEADQASYDRAFAESIVRHLEIETSIEPGRKHATIARIQQLLGDSDAAVLHWEAALKVHTRDPSYRLEYCQSLYRVGRNDEALKQAVLGQTLYPVDKRFERWTAQIRRDIRLGNRH